MSKKRKRKAFPVDRPKGKKGRDAKAGQKTDFKQATSEQNVDVVRESVEAIAVAILLALLFRGFEAEAFVIPTGSMASTLQGAHKDICCAQCGYRYRAGAAREASGYEVREVNCPMCRYQTTLDPTNAEHQTFSGDRILVNKFVYQIADPKRWDVIVFKYPGNAKQNYIKRLIGLPGETIWLRWGDVYLQKPDATALEIQRKPVSKIPYMLHLVHDTNYVPKHLAELNWPTRWIDPEGRWSASEDHKSYALEKSSATAWLNYRHLPPKRKDWSGILQGNLPRDISQRKGELIADYYEYNDYVASSLGDNHKRSGFHWVGDLAMETNIEIEGSGDLYLRLIEGGHKILCAIDTATGVAEITIDEGETPFLGINGKSPTKTITAQTPIRKSGSYRLMLANVDDQVVLWVNRKAVEFAADGAAHPGYFKLPENMRPQWSESDPGDLMPAAIGSRGVAVTTKRLRVYRDIYYIAVDVNRGSATDYRPGSGWESTHNHPQIQQVFRSPDLWATTSLFDARYDDVHFKLEKGATPELDQFLPMGDNSPASKDARLWGLEKSEYFPKKGVMVNKYVERELLIGKAFMVYWPHGWPIGNTPIYPILPNLDRMGLIR